jgi:hypothetical protein
VVQSNFEDAEAVKLLTGGTSKNGTCLSEPGHLGVGQNDGDATKIIKLLPSGCV